MGSIRPHPQHHILGCCCGRLHRSSMRRDGQSLGSCLKALRLHTCKASPMLGIAVPAPKDCSSEPESWKSLKSCDSMVATSHEWLFLNEFKLGLKLSSSVSLATFQVPNSHRWLVATILDSTDREHLYHFRKFYWTVLFLDLNLLLTSIAF